MEFLQNGQIEPSIIGKEYFILLIHLILEPSSVHRFGSRSGPLNGKLIKYTEHHKRKTEANTKDENEKSVQEKTEIPETDTVTDTPGKDPEVMAKKKPEREFEEPKDETAKDEAA